MIISDEDLYQLMHTHFKYNQHYISGCSGGVACGHDPIRQYQRNGAEKVTLILTLTMYALLFLMICSDAACSKEKDNNCAFRVCRIRKAIFTG